jgi:hypothetical protein
MVILFVEGGESIEWKVGDIWKITHLLQELFELLASLPEERLHLRTFKDGGATSIKFLGQQSLDHFIGHFYQRNIALYNPIIDFIQPLQAGEGDEGNEDGQDPNGYESKEQFLGYGQAKKLGHDSSHGSSILFSGRIVPRPAYCGIGGFPAYRQARRGTI